MTDIATDLNATIAAAVNARVEAAVAAALSGDEILGQYVAAALNQVIDVKGSSGYRSEKKTYLRHTIDTAMRAAVKMAVERVLADETPLIEDEIRKAFKRDAGKLAAGLVKSLADAADKTYGVTVELKMPQR